MISEGVLSDRALGMLDEESQQPASNIAWQPAKQQGLALGMAPSSRHERAEPRSASATPLARHRADCFMAASALSRPIDPSL